MNMAVAFAKLSICTHADRDIARLEMTSTCKASPTRVNAADVDISCDRNAGQDYIAASMQQEQVHGAGPECIIAFAYEAWHVREPVSAGKKLGLVPSGASCCRECP